ncbi:hypothetical protein BH09MYX1_BH09MYX1_24920 [soil metagenome]
MKSQIDLRWSRRGGKREGAGRPLGSRVAHASRSWFNGKTTPLHLTVKMTRGVWNLRSQRAFHHVQRALVAERKRGELRVVHYSVQGNHIHIVAEVDDAATLSRRMQGFGIRLARSLNKMMGRRGRVLADRFHARPLKSARQVNNTLRYVLLNHHIHRARDGRLGARLDHFSSAVTTHADFVDVSGAGPPPLLAPAETWVLVRGWTRGAF